MWRLSFFSPLIALDSHFWLCGCHLTIFVFVCVPPARRRWSWLERDSWLTLRRKMVSLRCIWPPWTTTVMWLRFSSKRWERFTSENTAVCENACTVRHLQWKAESKCFDSMTVILKHYTISSKSLTKPVKESKPNWFKLLEYRKYAYCVDTSKIYMLHNVLNSVLSLFLFWQAQTKSTGVYIKLNARFSLLCNQNTNNNQKKMCIMQEL